VSKLYFIQSGENGPIKIGHSSDPDERLASLQVGNPQHLRLLAAVEFGSDAAAQEQLCHRTFRVEHIRGEWFQPSHLLIGTIYCMKNEIPFSVVPDSEILIDGRDATVEQLDAIRAEMSR